MNIAQVCMGEESPGMLRNPAGKKVNDTRLEMCEQ